MSDNQSQEPQTHRQVAVELFNRTWELLDKQPRSEDDEAEMLTAAFASRYHWRQVGDAENLGASDWQVSRVAAVLGYPDLAEEYGRRSLHVASVAGLGPFYIGYAHEAMARAARLAGNRDDVVAQLEAAHDMLAQIEDTRERDLLGADLKESAGR